MNVLKAAAKASDGSKVLTRGLEVLRILIEADAPITSTEVSKKIGLHQSTASRILRALMRAGYVRKPDYHSFSVDYGVITLCGNGARHFALCNQPLQPMVALSEKYPELSFALGGIWDKELIYFLRVTHGHDPVRAAVTGCPLHLSSVGMRLLLDMPEAEALELLAASKRRYGWTRPTARVPANEKASLVAARSMLHYDCLVLEDWNSPKQMTAAVPLAIKSDLPVCMAVYGSNHPDTKTTVLILQEARRAVEQALMQSVQ